MTDMEVIAKIERSLQIKLEIITSSRATNGYLRDFTGNVIALNLYNCEISNLPHLISHLLRFKKLRELFLERNQLSAIDPLSELTQLTKLSLYGNPITSIYPLTNLKKLQSLEISDGLFADIKDLSHLTNLRKLIIFQCEITDLDPLVRLDGLQELTLDDNKITDCLPIQACTELVSLSIRGNKISNIEALRNLNKLKKAWVSFNSVSDISPLADLKQLTSLELAENRIINIKPLENLVNLTYLNCSYNRIKNIHSLKHLTNLEALFLDQNLITDLSPILGLKCGVALNNNKIERLPRDIMNSNWKIDLDKPSFEVESGELLLGGNSLSDPPIEIIRQGKEAIKRYFERINQEGVDYIYEAKLTFVGEGSSGKTSLQRRLVNEKAALPRKDKRTRGIAIVDWTFKKEKGVEHIAHIWDFGGQDVYYPVHRFFLTENSVFVLLASTRQTHHNFDYWIPTIHQFGAQSPIILGQTCHDRNKIPWNDLDVYIGNPNFNIIKTQALPYYELDLPNRNEGLKKIKQVIIDQITGLPRYGRTVPKSWVPVRNSLNELSKNTACIPFEKFKDLCTNSNPDSFKDVTDIKDCCQFLHDIGVVLWYSASDELREWVILQPEWAMNAVYKIIDDEDIQRRKGHIQSKDFTRLWNEATYSDKHPILKKMLEIFKIAFPKKHKQSDYIIPARLLSIPNEKKWQNTEPCLRLEYRYEFMPRGMVNQVSAELSRYITAENEVWNNAVNLSSQDNTAQCQVEEDFYNRKIIIKSKGKDARSLIVLVMDALNNITEGYKGVKPEIYVPCICTMCRTGKSKRLTTFLYDDLLRWLRNDPNAPVTCNESRETMIIEDLLFNVGLATPEKPDAKENGRKTISIFLASSSEMKEDREQFEIFINRENKRLNEHGIFLRVDIWEDFIDAMSEESLQEEYNKVVRKSDIFVSLFHTKVGKYTAIEFETAFGQFKQSGTPRIYTYFRDGDINMKKIDKEINSRLDFIEKLNSLGHFETHYENIDQLKFHFKSQLEKLLPEL